VLPRSGLKVADRPDRTDFGLDQTAQAVCGPQIVDHGPDRGLWAWLAHYYFQNRVVQFILFVISLIQSSIDLVNIITLCALTESPSSLFLAIVSLENVSK